MILWPQEFQNVDHSLLESQTFNTANFCKYGVQVLRGFLASPELSEIKVGLANARQRDFHPVAYDLSLENQKAILSSSIRNRIHNDFSELLGPDIGLTGSRFLIKPPGNQATVPLHQDLGYHIGSFNQVSLFCSINGMSALNGGMTLVVGSHHLGYLGDAGSLEAIHPHSAEFCPSLQPGDCIAMHCATAHFSPENRTNCSRDLLEILLCPSEQPWRIDDILSSAPQKSYFEKLNPDSIKIFKSSRGQRLQMIRKILDQQS